jgi:hypothetical protein
MTGVVASPAALPAHGLTIGWPACDLCRENLVVFVKYPRTRHVEGSRRQPGDFDLDAVPFAAIAGCRLVVEEKLDGANAAIAFAPDGTLRLQSRGHVLSGGPRERQFAPFKAWAAGISDLLWARLADRYVLFGEWLFAKHTVFYDALPHYFAAFDLYDTHRRAFVSTPRRNEMLAGTPVVSVPILFTGVVDSLTELTKLIAPSTCRTPNWRGVLVEAAVSAGCDPAQVVAETDDAEEMEGLYIKVEDDDYTLDRFKWVRASFLTAVLDSGTHWSDRPIVPNRLADPAVMYERL